MPNARSGASRLVTEKLDLLVIGCGPTGIAALYDASREGLSAVGVEAGSRPAAAIAGYLPGLVLGSSPQEFEVGRLPLDCRDPFELSREEVLHYYNRVIIHAQLDIRCNHRCVAIKPESAGVRIVTQTPMGKRIFAAKDVLVTSWFSPKKLAGIRAPTEPPCPNENRFSVVVGGGISGYEHASALMLRGERVAVVARGPFPWYYFTKEFSSLTQLTNSRLIHEANVVGSRAGKILVRKKGGATQVLSCSRLVWCIGAQVDPHILGILKKAGVLTSRPIRAIRAMSLSGSLADDAPQQGARVVNDDHPPPDLWRYLFSGVKGVRFAGGVLHRGGPNAGVVTSIYTAQLAIQAILGRPLPSGLRRPLPQALRHWVSGRIIGPPPFEVISSLRPFHIHAWTRVILPLRSERPRLGKYVLGLRRLDRFMKRSFQLSDGSRSVQQIAQVLQMTTTSEQSMLSACFYALWRCNALTWLPPPRPREDEREDEQQR